MVSSFLLILMTLCHKSFSQPITGSMNSTTIEANVQPVKGDASFVQTNAPTVQINALPLQTNLPVQGTILQGTIQPLQPLQSLQDNLSLLSQMSSLGTGSNSDIQASLLNKSPFSSNLPVLQQLLPSEDISSLISAMTNLKKSEYGNKGTEFLTCSIRQCNKTAEEFCNIISMKPEELSSCINEYNGPSCYSPTFIPCSFLIGVLDTIKTISNKNVHF